MENRDKPVAKPKLAVIIPAYNMRSRYDSDGEFTGVLDHYDDLARQYGDSIEFHVVDDCSSDTSPDLMRTFREGDSAINFHYMPENAQKIGAIKHVINGLEDEVESILHTDFDCRFEGDALDNALTHAEELAENPELGGFGLRVVPTKTNSLLNAWQEWEYAVGRFSYVLLKYEGKTRCVGGAGGLWNRQVYEEQLENHSGMFISEDMEQTARIMHSGKRIGYAKDVVLTTNTPETVRSLLKQRVRWAKGALYSYHNVREFYIPQALKFIPRKSVHGLATAIQMTKLATTPAWGVFTAEKLFEQNWDAGLLIYGLGLGVNTALSALSRKEFDNTLRSFAVLPLTPLIGYGVYLSAHSVAYAQFAKEMAQKYTPSLKRKITHTKNKILDFGRDIAERFVPKQSEEQNEVISAG